MKKSKPEYQHKSVQRLYEEYLKHKEEMGQGLGFGLIWRSISPSVPELLKGLDQDPEMLGKIKSFLETIMDALKEDVGEKAIEAISELKQSTDKAEGERSAT